MCTALFMTDAHAAGQNGFYEHVHASDALWTFDTTCMVWQQRHPTGDVPSPQSACHLEVFRGAAYLLVNDHVGSKCMEVYQLNLETWHWRKVACTGQMPRCVEASSASIVQVSKADACFFCVDAEQQLHDSGTEGVMTLLKAALPSAVCILQNEWTQVWFIMILCIITCPQVVCSRETC